MQNNNYIAIDIKTSGRDPYSDYIKMISAVKFTSAAEKGRFSCTIESRELPVIDQKIVMGTQKTKKFFSFRSAYSDLLKFIGDANLISHFSYPDRVFFENVCARNHLIMFSNEWIDTQEIMLGQHNGRSKMSDAIEIFGLKANTRSIFSDVEITKNIFMRSIH